MLGSLTTPQATITGCVALARCGKPEDQAWILESLGKLDWSKLNRTERLELLRAYQLSFTRLGVPSDEARQKVIAHLDTQFPTMDDDTILNRELATVLIYVRAPGIVDRCVTRMTSASSVDEQILYAISLREAIDFNDATRKAYFQWFFDIATARGGASFGGFIENIRQVAIGKLNDEQKQALGDLVGALPAPKDPLADLAPRPVVQEWKVEELVGDLEAKKSGFNFERGKQMFAVALCYKCHRFAGQGVSKARTSPVQAVDSPRKISSLQSSNPTKRSAINIRQLNS